MKHLTLNQSISQLEIIASDIANTEDKERRHEGKNLIFCIWGAKEALNEGDLDEADFILNEVGKRINELMKKADDNNLTE